MTLILTYRSPVHFLSLLLLLLQARLHPVAVSTALLEARPAVVAANWSSGVATSGDDQDTEIFGIAQQSHDTYNCRDESCGNTIYRRCFRNDATTTTTTKEPRSFITRPITSTTTAVDDEVAGERS